MPIKFPVKTRLSDPISLIWLTCPRRLSLFINNVIMNQMLPYELTLMRLQLIRLFRRLFIFAKLATQNNKCWAYSLPPEDNKCNDACSNTESLLFVAFSSRCSTFLISLFMFNFATLITFGIIFFFA